MSSTSRLTSRNLFDDVFATIPADVFLYIGPDSLQERYALSAVSHAAVEKVDDVNWQDERDIVDDAQHFALHRRAKGTNVVDVGAAIRSCDELNKKINETTSTASFQDLLDICIDAEDEAVQEATKHAALFIDIDNEEDERDESKKDKESMERDSFGSKSEFLVSDNRTKQHKRQRRQEKEEHMQRDVVSKLGRKSMSAEEQINIMQPDQGNRHKGRCVLFRQNKGFGFVTPDVGGPDVYFTRDNIEYYFTRRVLEVFYGEKFLDMLKLKEASTANRKVSTENKGGETIPLREAFSSNAASTNATNNGNTHSDVEAERKVDEGDSMGGAQRGPDSQCEEKETTSKAEKGAEDVTESLTRQAAAHLTPEAARLLLLFLQLGKPTIYVQEAVTFTVRWNRTGSRAGRRLRADEIRGLPSDGYALAVERAWFDRVFSSHPNNRTSLKSGGSCAKSSTEVCLPRHRGTIRMYDADELRGIIRSDDGGAQNVLFYSDAFLWDLSMDYACCRPAVGLVVRYSLAGRDCHGKYIATLITATDDTPLSEANAVWAVANSAGDFDERQQGGVTRNGDDGGDDVGDEEMKGMKRTRHEELPLLEEDGYGVI